MFNFNEVISTLGQNELETLDDTRSENYHQVVGHSTHEVFVSYVVSPDQFWIQKKSDADSLDDMRNEIYDMYDGPNSASVLPFFKPVVGSQIYAARHVDGDWYRVQLMAVSDHLSAEAHFVDYGDSHTVSWTHIRPLPKKWFNVAPFAIRCRLQIPNRPNQWSQEMVQFFIGNCKSDVVFNAVFGPKEGDIQPVKSLSSTNSNIVDELIKILAAKNIPQVQSVVQKTSSTSALQINASIIRSVPTLIATPPELKVISLIILFNY